MAEKETKQSLVYAYGCGSPHDDPHVRAEVARMHDFWDALVDIDREADRREIDIAADQAAETAVARARYMTCQQALDVLITERRAARAAARKKIPTPELDQRITEAFAARNEARAALYAAMKVWRKEKPETVKELYAQRRAAMKAARQSSGLYWANYNRVIDSYQRGRKQALKKGRRMRYIDRSRHDGVLTVQIQRTSTGLGAAPGELHGKVPALVIGEVRFDPNAPRGERRQQARTRVTLRVDAAGHEVTVAMWMHRPLPFGSRVKSAQMSWRREGERIKAQTVRHGQHAGEADHTSIPPRGRHRYRMAAPEGRRPADRHAA